jgi:hypothetical protein
LCFGGGLTTVGKTPGDATDGNPMDVKALRERAVEATARFFLDKQGYAPSDESDEWEDEYRRQFELLKKRAATPAAAAAPAPALGPADEGTAAWPELRGAPAEQRWAAKLRSERLPQIHGKALRDWLAEAWTSAKDWIDSRDLSTAMFLQRAERQHAEHRRQSEQRARALEAERQSKAAAAEVDRRAVAAAGLTAAGLVELVDVSPRTAPATVKLKLAELDAGGRNLRIFETNAADRLMVIDTGEAGRSEYAIESDAALVADLKLFARAQRS